MVEACVACGVGRGTGDCLVRPDGKRESRPVKMKAKRRRGRAQGGGGAERSERQPRRGEAEAEAKAVRAERGSRETRQGTITAVLFGDGAAERA